MTAPTMTVKPLFVRWIKLEVEVAGVTHTFECAVTQAGLTSTGGDPVSINTLCPGGSFSEATERAWNLVVTGVQDVESADSFQLFLLEHDGEEATFLFYPKTDKNGTPVGTGFPSSVESSVTNASKAGRAISGRAAAAYDGRFPLRVDACSVN